MAREIEINVDTSKAMMEIEDLSKKAADMMCYMRELARACRAFADAFEEAPFPKEATDD